VMLAVIETQDRLVECLRRLPRERLLAMYEAAAEATECAAALAQRGANPVTEALAGATVFEEWMHFPPGDVIDPQTHSQFYYHAHAAEDRIDNEHGHFHTFVRPRQLDPALRPAPLPDASDDKNACTHLIGISTDASGHIIRLFTTNRWVTGESWYDADAVISLLDRFDITIEMPSHDLNRWVSAIVRMFRPQIEELLRARDVAVASQPSDNVFEDRALQVTSEIPVDFLAQIRAIEAALA
jgi:Domain of unknown function (DUF6969)